MELRLRARLVGALGYAPARPDFAGGLRAATATTLPLILADRSHRAALTLVALGAWLGTLADTGGSVRVRVRTALAFVVVGPLALALGMVFGQSVALGAVATFAWCATGALGMVYGAAGTTFGTLMSVTFCVGFGRPATASVALHAALMLAVGALWAQVLALALWRIHPHGAARAAASACYMRLAEFVGGIEKLARASGGAADLEAWRALSRAEHKRIREALEVARATAGETRARRAGRSADGDRLRVAVAGADQLFGALIALEIELSSAGQLAGRAADALGEVSRTLAGIALVVQSRTRVGRAPPLDVLDAALRSLRDGRTRESDDPRAALHLGRAVLLVERAAMFARATLEATVPRGALPESARIALGVEARPGPWTTLRDALAPGSRALHHALRTGLVAGASVPLGAALGLGHASWLTTTAVLVLQPYAGGTRARVVQRVAGTVAGGLLAAALVVTVRSPLLVALAMFPLALTAVAVKPMGYGLYTLFLTPVFLLMAERSPGDWSLAIARGENTVVGGALALLAAYVVWPAHERRRLPRELAGVLAALRGYLAAAFARWRGAPGATREQVMRARRAVGLANNDAEASLQRVLGEPRRDAAVVDAASTLLTYARRVGSSIAALSFNATHGVAMPAYAADVAAQLDAALADLEHALGEERAPSLGAPEPVDAELDAADADDPHSALVAAQLRRVTRQVRVMHAAVERLATRAAPGATG